MPAALITIAQAREQVLSQVTQLAAELVDLDGGLERVLAGEILAAGDVPAFASSAMDGYAVQSGGAGRRLELIGESRAGSPSVLTVADGQAIRISTGAAVPAGANAVIRQEDVRETSARAILTGADVREGANVRGAGEDMRRGASVLQRGTLLGPAELGAAAAAGAGELPVTRRPVVSVLCTGDELRAPGEPLGPGEIHNSNAPMLIGLARRSGAIATGAQRLADDRGATEQGLEEALAGSDVVVVSGGVSVGPHDHVKPALAALNVDERFWRVALQPGKPTWFGTRGSKLVFGLPGNPVSAVVTFALFVAPALAALLGQRPSDSQPTTATLGVGVSQNPDREQALRVKARYTRGGLTVTPNGPQGSHIVSSLVGADALALIPRGTGELPAGSSVSLVPMML
ncbi:MAG: molybdopterin molybdotransferase MoeA [Solirubrobacteraceae bacterium]